MVALAALRWCGPNLVTWSVHVAARLLRRRCLRYMALTTEQQAKLARLEAKSSLTEKQERKLAKLRKRSAAAGDTAPAEKRQKTAVGAAAPTETVPEAGSASEPKPTKAAAPPPVKATVGSGDLTLTCATCAVAFPFTADEQNWFAERGWYRPKNCKDCAALKKERFETKDEKKKSSNRLGESKCYNCGRAGHLSSQCPAPKGSGAACYTCGSEDHLSRNCPLAAKAAKIKACFNCGSEEHMSKDCPQPKPTPICFNCGEKIGSEAHPLKACTQPKRTEGVCYAFRNGRCDRKNCKFTHEAS